MLALPPRQSFVRSVVMEGVYHVTLAPPEKALVLLNGN